MIVYEIIALAGSQKLNSVEIFSSQSSNFYQIPENNVFAVRGFRKCEHFFLFSKHTLTKNKNIMKSAMIKLAI